MITAADIVHYDGYNLIIRPYDKIGRELERKHPKTVEVRIVDGRTISDIQRRKIYAILRDISDWNGDEPEWLKEYFKFIFCGEYGYSYFSLSDCEMSIATAFISFLIDFCLYYDVPTRRKMVEYADDVGRYLYSCLEHKKCAVCGRAGEVHHVDKVGMGRDREQIVHVGLRAICLCRDHHTQAHNDERAFLEANHIYGLELDEYLCSKLNLNTKGC